MEESIQLGKGWEVLAQRVVDCGGAVVVVGGVDTGKSTFVAWLAAFAAHRGRRTWIVDADVGQSALGPPATIAAGPVSPMGIASRAPKGLYFVGNHTPRGHMLPCVVGAGRLAERARASGAELIVVNTSGWVADGAAAALKTAKIDLLRPRSLVALERGDELRLILRAYQGMREPQVLRCALSPAVRARSAAEREAARQQRWAEYLAHAAPFELDFDKVALSGEDPLVLGAHDQRGRSVGLYDDTDECLAVGLVVGLRVEQRRLKVLAPVEAAKVRRVHFGHCMVPGFSNAILTLASESSPDIRAPEPRSRS